MKILANDGISESGKNKLEEYGFEVDLTTVSQEQLVSYINENEISTILVRSATKVRKDVIDSCKSLKLIGRGGVGMDNIDVEYAKANPDEVFGSVAEATGTDVEFFRRWFAEYSDFPVLMSQSDMKAVQTLWDQAKTLGMLKESPDISSAVWSETLKE